MSPQTHLMRDRVKTDQDGKREVVFGENGGQMFFAIFSFLFYFFKIPQKTRKTGNFSLKLRGVIETEGRKEKKRRNNSAVVGKMSTELGIIQHGKLRLVIITFCGYNIYCLVIFPSSTQHRDIGMVEAKFGLHEAHGMEG